MIRLNGQQIVSAHFPDGTSSVRTAVPEENRITLQWCFDGNSEMAEVFFLVNHIRTHNRKAELILEMPYIPNARMDRVKNDDEVFTLKYFAGFINSLGFDCVKVCDPHSDVSAALIDRIEKIPHLPFIEKVMETVGFNPEKDIMFYPDAGCAKKYEQVINLPYLKGEKKRDWRTGKIQELKISGDIPAVDFRVLIVDDICSRGGTFYYSAQKLKEAGAGDIFLYITHCENTILEGELIKSGLVKKIFTTDSIFTEKNELISTVHSFRQRGE